MRSQIATSNIPLGKKAGSEARGGRRYYPFAFTEYGAIMAASVLNSPKAVEMSIFVVRAFVRMRETLSTNQKIVSKLKDLERKVGDHDAEIEEIVDALRELMEPPARAGRRIGFQVPKANV